jgi:bacteriorhodopsin
MTIKNMLYYSAYISLIVQLLTGAVGSLGLFIKLKPEDKVLSDVLLMETFVQFVEFIFYAWLVSNLNNVPDNITILRYIDWNITTPIMLISTILYMKYNTLKEKNKRKTTEEILNEDKDIILRITLYNFLMLMFGLLGELNYLSRYISFTAGFIFFYLSFKEIYVNYVNNNELNINLFNFLFIVWSLYGVAALFNFELKNISYNFLDIISKNFYGLFIFYIIYQTNLNY